MSLQLWAIRPVFIRTDKPVTVAGNVFTASIHIVTVVVGAGVLALAWAMAQLGWIAGIAVMVLFACISVYTYNLIADCYRYPDPVSGKRNYTYMQAVDAYLGIIILLNLLSLPIYSYACIRID